MIVPNMLSEVQGGNDGRIRKKRRNWMGSDDGERIRKGKR